jgi:hypothetical protein
MTEQVCKYKAGGEPVPCDINGETYFVRILSIGEGSSGSSGRSTGGECGIENAIETTAKKWRDSKPSRIKNYGRSAKDGTPRGGKEQTLSCLCSLCGMLIMVKTQVVLED